jgi:hypothetical protein
VAAGRGVNGVGGSMRHHFMNFRGLSQSMHKRVHGKWDRKNNLPPFGALRGYAYGTPPWFHGASGFPLIGGLAEWLDSEDPCVCGN